MLRFLLLGVWVSLVACSGTETPSQPTPNPFAPCQQVGKEMLSCPVAPGSDLLAANCAAVSITSGGKVITAAGPGVVMHRNTSGTEEIDTVTFSGVTTCNSDVGFGKH